MKSPITDIKGIGPKKAEAFARLGLSSLSDLLWFFPRDYEDLRNIKHIKDLKNDEKALVESVVRMNVMGRGFGRKRTLHLSVSDKTRDMEVLFFMAGFMGKTFKVGECYRFFGKVKREGSKVTMFHPTFGPAGEGESGIQPVYPLTRGLTQKDVKKAVKTALAMSSELQETLPEDIISKANICPLDYALSNIHFPGDGSNYSEARYRLVFEELFDLKLALSLSKDRFGLGRAGRSFAKGNTKDFTDTLSYELTNAQKRVLGEIEKDMDSTMAMNRLVQGDVGSGKTIVAEAAIYKAVSAGYQAAFMAPTEILASQHFANFSKDFASFDIDIEYLSSSNTAAERNEVLRKLADGSCDIVIGTHAVISESVKFDRLGLVITDEQHRFGVNQRKMLSDTGENPDILVMTATPIPRT
ncbi:MAG: DEAD/DEAH box helicase, partial [Firmicutes bacterium]|nr:DEAD/DEAH box helicase [Bacillota bacterium]